LGFVVGPALNAILGFNVGSELEVFVVGRLDGTIDGTLDGEIEGRQVGYVKGASL